MDEQWRVREFLSGTGVGTGEGTTDGLGLNINSESGDEEVGIDGLGGTCGGVGSALIKILKIKLQQKAELKYC